MELEAIKISSVGERQRRRDLIKAIFRQTNAGLKALRGVKFEDLKDSLDQVFGSIQAGDEALDKVFTFAQTTPFQIEDATKAIENISEKIDLAFIDADKVNYTKYYDMLFPKLKIGGLIVADNVLWSGKVTEDVSDNETQSIKNFNTKVKNDERVENLIVGIRDGIMVCQKIKD